MQVVEGELTHQLTTEGIHSFIKQRSDMDVMMAVVLVPDKMTKTVIPTLLVKEGYNPTDEEKNQFHLRASVAQQLSLAGKKPTGNIMCTVIYSDGKEMGVAHIQKSDW